MSWATVAAARSSRPTFTSGNRVKGVVGRECCTTTTRTSTSAGYGRTSLPSAPIRPSRPAARWSVQSRHRNLSPPSPPNPTGR